VCNSEQTDIVVPLIIILAPCQIPQSAYSPRQGAADQRSIMFDVPTVLFLTLSLWQFVDLAFFVIMVIVFVQAFNGKRIMLPIVGGLAERQANR
jgi:uncharacterized membrane protein